MDIEDAAAYLEAALEEADNDSAYVAEALGIVARSDNVSELAPRVGMSREGLSKTLSAEGNPSFATIITSPRHSASRSTSGRRPDPGQWRP